MQAWEEDQRANTPSPRYAPLLVAYRLRGKSKYVAHLALLRISSSSHPLFAPLFGPITVRQTQ